jgi:glutathione synthase/RimK-type ligase-like ATP-grasp enzyme
MTLCFTAVRRDPLYSPGHIENDARILEATAQRLRELGHHVSVIEETQLDGQEPAPVIFAMCQSRRGIEWLRDREARKHVVINRPQAILNCYRENLVRVLEVQGIGMPPTVVVPTDRKRLRLPVNIARAPGIWVKRGDAHALRKDDVVRVENAKEVMDALESLHARGVRVAVVQAHVEGALLKFYAVRGTRFFRRYVAGSTQVAGLDSERLQQTAARAAVALGLDVYGGDVIVQGSGEIVFVDINDWPSFAPCWDKAATPIARRILRRAGAKKDATE